MNRFLLLIVCVLIALHSFSQQPSPVQASPQQSSIIQILRSDALIGFTPAGLARFLKPVFEHEGSTLASDSAHVNTQQNTFDAFGHIVITQVDGTVIRSDLLKYNGNTRIAIFTNNVRLTDSQGAVLITNSFTYNMETKIGNYINGGKIINKQDTLTSKTGYYFENSKDSYFRYNVVINTPDALVKSDTMRYNSETKLASFFGPTYIYMKGDTVRTDLGDYNTGTGQARGLKNNFYQQGTRTLTGDTLYYDDKKGTGQVMGNITFKDTEAETIIKGQLGFYSKVDSSTTITKDAYLIMVTEDGDKTDTLWLSADTLQTKVIRMSEFKPINIPQLKKDADVQDAETIRPAVADSIKRGVDPGIPVTLTPQSDAKTRVLFAFHRVKIFKSDLQAIADSVSYSYADSILRCYYSPMVWSEGSQLSSDTIFMQMKNQQIHHMILQRNGLIVTTGKDSTLFDQIKGRIITGLFKDNNLTQLYVDGNAESLKYIEQDSSYNVSRSISGRIKLDFANNELVAARFIRKAEGTISPLPMLKEDFKLLQGFIWKPKDRPKSAADIILSLRNKPSAAIQSPPVKAEPPPTSSPGK